MSKTEHNGIQVRELPIKGVNRGLKLHDKLVYPTDFLIYICYSLAALRRCLEGVEGVLRGFLQRDEANFRCSDPFEVGPLLLRGVADTVDLAALVGLDAYDPLIGSRCRILVPVGTLTMASCLADGPLRSRACGGAVRIDWA